MPKKSTMLKFNTTPKKSTILQIFKFIKGQRLHLDDIYYVKGLGDDLVIGKWWNSINPVGEEVEIIKDIEIEITFKYKE